MATQNTDSADLKGVDFGGLIREDVMNKIWDISKIPLPFTDMVGSDKSKNEYKEWTKDELAAPATDNAVVDGSDADASRNDVVLGERVGNHHQISDKVVRVSYRADASDTIGRAKELSYQLMRKQQELKRDVDSTALFNQASLADDGNTTAGLVGGLPSWIETTCVSPNGDHTAGGYNTSTGKTVAYTAGTAGALTETLVRDVAQSVYQQGGNPGVLMSMPAIIRKFSEYLFTASARIGTILSDQGKSSEKATAMGSVSVFVTDFGTLRFVPNRLQSALDGTTDGSSAVGFAFILDPEYLSLCYLKGYRTDKLAKLGLAENRQMCVDWSLIVNTEKAHGMIGDIDGAADVTA